MEVYYDIEKLTFSELKHNIALPSFQRSLVWSENKKQSFIQTILSGAPFGTLLLYRDGINNYSLIDGLQRFSTLCDYEKSPGKYIDFKTFCGTEILEIINEYIARYNIKGNVEKMFEEFVGVIKDIFTFNSNQTMDDKSVLKKLYNDISFFTEESIGFDLSLFLHKLKTQLSISELKIPVIIFKGDFERLAEIFEETNTNGTQLSKYDIYAARWGNLKLKVDDNELLKAVDDRYIAMQESTNMEIMGYDEGSVFKEKILNLYEYCFAVGKLIKQKSTSIFEQSNNKKDEKSKLDSIGFNIVAAILLDAPKRKDKLLQYFSNNSVNIIDLKDKILECFMFVDKMLMPYLVTCSGANVSRYIESQITCMVSTLFKIKYSINNETGNIEKNTSRDRKLKLEKFIDICPLRYLYDILTDYWGNSGDQKVAEELNNNLSNNRYLIKITKGDFETVLEEWIRQQKNKGLKNVPKENKLFFNYLFYANNCKSDLFSKIGSKPVEIDFIIPKKRYKSIFNDTSGVAHICNIIFLPQFENHSKNEHTMYEIECAKLSVWNIDEQALNDLLYPTRDELNFLNQGNTCTPSKYNSFINARKNYLINKFISLFFNK